jgi:hypothetical protein
MAELTDEQILAQIPAAREAERIADRTEPRARSAAYDPETGRVMVELKNGGAFAFPPDLVEELRGATPAEIAAVRLSPTGDALSWESRDTDVSVEGLFHELVGIAPAARRLGRRGGRTTSAAKARAARANGQKGGRPRKTT